MKNPNKPAFPMIFPHVFPCSNMAFPDMNHDKNHGFPKISCHVSRAGPIPPWGATRAKSGPSLGHLPRNRCEAHDHVMGRHGPQRFCTRDTLWFFEFPIMWYSNSTIMCHFEYINENIWFRIYPLVLFKQAHVQTWLFEYALFMWFSSWNHHINHDK